MGNEKTCVLYIDDEVNNLNAFRAIFRRQYKIYTCSSTLEARKVLSDTTIHVIISDQRMPDTTGVEFFNVIKEKFPDPMRILLTAYSDIGAAIDAINKGQIFKYIKKPWDDLELENAIDTAYQIYCIRKELENNVKGIERINYVNNKIMYEVSDALKSTLLSTTGIIKLSYSDPTSKDPSGYLNTIGDNILRSYNLIEYVFGYFKHSKSVLEYNRINFDAMLRDCYESCHGRESKIKFQHTVAQETEFYTDKFRLTQVFKYVISGIIRYKKPAHSGLVIPLSIIVNNDDTVIHIGDNKTAILSTPLLQLFYSASDENKSHDPMLDIELYIIREALNCIDAQIIGETGNLGSKSKLSLRIPNKRSSPEVGSN